VASPLGFEVSLDAPHAAAVERVVDALQQQGFGVLTRIDLHVAFREKLGVAFRPYTILGACNPPLAHRAVSAAPEVGLLLPCNVTVEAEAGGGSRVRIANPEEMMRLGGFAPGSPIAEVGRDARVRLERVAAALSG
jgi:uncharacterized protein (DUF302 family)